MAESHSLGGKRTGVNLGGDIQHQCSETAVHFFSRLHLPTPFLYKMALPSSPMAQHEATRLRGTVLHDPVEQSIASVLLHHTCKFTQTNRIRAAFSVVSRAASQSPCLNRVPHRTSLHASVWVPTADSASILVSIPGPLTTMARLPPRTNNGTRQVIAERRCFLLFSETYTLRDSAEQY